MEVQYENKEICSKCGICCKKSGCDYLPKDFEEMGYKYLEEKLKEGNISIVCTCSFRVLHNGKKYVEPFLYMRARNINRPVIDLLSMKTTCKMLKEDGCSYELGDRPSLGVNLMPKEDMKCYPLEDPLKLIKQWEPYQRVLSKLVKRISGLSVDGRLRSDIENLFYDVMSKNFEGVSLIELEDIKKMLPLLIEVYPCEYTNAKERLKKEKYPLVMNMN